MKKTLILLVLSIAIFTSVYAQGFNINTGIGYANRSFKIEESGEESSIGFNAFQAQIGIDYTFRNNMFLYGDFSMAFPSKIFAKNDGEKQTLSKKRISNFLIESMKSSTGYDFSIDKTLLLGYGFSVGCGYCLKPVQNLTIKLGGGFRYDAGLLKFKDITIRSASSQSMDEKLIISTIGLNFQFETDYLISDHVGIMLSLKPNIGFHTFMKAKVKGSSDALNMNATENRDYSKCSFTFNATAGMVFAF